ncbi:MAG: hypothetical protein ACPH64_02660 [Porticoccaceae bacterium]
MKHRLAVTGFTACFLLCLSGSLGAEQILLPLGQQTNNSNLDLPQRGDTKDQVIHSLGEPEIMQSAVGEPPITVWEYSGLLVYFERDWVLRTVVRHPEHWEPLKKTGQEP